MIFHSYVKSPEVITTTWLSISPLRWSQELQFVEDVVLVYGGWADPGGVPHGVHGTPSQGSMASLEVFKLRQVRIPEARASNGPGPAIKKAITRLMNITNISIFITI